MRRSDVSEKKKKKKEEEEDEEEEEEEKFLKGRVTAGRRSRACASAALAQ